MIIGTGCDIVEHALTKKLNWHTNKSVQKRIFSVEELKLYNTSQDVRFLAGRFAAKEAVLKSLGTGMADGIYLTDINILKAEFNLPVVLLNGTIKEIAERKGITKWHISISHSSKFTIANVIAES